MLRKAILDGPENGYGTHSEFLPWDFISRILLLPISSGLLGPWKFYIQCAN